MPVPKIFRRLASKNSLRTSSGTTTVPDVPAVHERDISSRTLVTATVVPAFPENLTEAWAIAQKELPKAKGMGEILNHVGTPTVDGTM